MASEGASKGVESDKSTKKIVINQPETRVVSSDPLSQSSVQLTREQFMELLQHLPTMSKKNFVPCTIRFHGENDHNKVEEFINGIKLYKKMEQISDEDALTGLPLLLKDKASDWWRGVRAEIRTWTAALKAISAAFSPQKQPHDIYVEIFATPQGRDEIIDDFLCRKRLLLGALPQKRHKEEEQIDLIYGLLRVDLRKHIARHDIFSFAELIEKARHQEALSGFKQKLINNKPSTSSGPQELQPTRAKSNQIRCTYCSKRGHTMEVCRKRLAKMSLDNNDAMATSSGVVKPVVACYGCGAPGVFRSNCATCNNKDTPPKEVAFYTIETTREDAVKIPTIEVKVYDETGYAYIDTAARTSVAGEHLYQLLKGKVYSLRSRPKYN